MALAGSATLTLVASVNTTGMLVNTARKTAQTETDPNPANDQSSVSLNADTLADIQVTKAISNPAPAVGEQVTFTVTATNLGPSPATGVVLTDQLPAGLAFVSATPSQGTYVSATGVWTVGEHRGHPVGGALHHGTRHAAGNVHQHGDQDGGQRDRIRTRPTTRGAPPVRRAWWPTSRSPRRPACPR